LRGWWVIPVGVQIPPSAPFRSDRGEARRPLLLFFLILIKDTLGKNLNMTSPFKV